MKLESMPSALTEKAPSGLHATAFEVLRSVVKPSARIVDLGAGTGAWCRRLTRGGFAVTPVDLDPTGWGALETPIVIADLNDDFPTCLEGSFDAVTALEVIEHLENPSAFLRRCRRLMADSGVLLVTTPNIENVAGRLRFLLAGQFRSFDRDPACNEPTHITPIQSYLFEKIYRAAGLRLISHGFNAPTESTRSLPKRLLLAGLRPLLAGIRGGDHHIFLLCKDD